MSSKKIVSLKKFRNKKFLKKLFSALRIPVVIIVVIASLFLSARLLGNVAVSNATDAIRQIGTLFSRGGGYPYSTDVSSFRKATSIGGNPMIVYDDSTVVLGSTANEIFNMSLGYSDSKVLSRNGRALVFSNSSNEVILQSKTEKLGSISEEGTVVAAAIAKDGSIATSYASEEYQSVLSVYNSRFKKIFQWNCSQERIADIALSSNGKKLAVVAVGTENAEIYTRLLVFNVNSSKPLSDTKYSGTLFLKVVYTSLNKIIAVGDNRTVVVNSRGETVDELVYSEDSIFAVCSDDSGNTVVFYEEFGGAKTGMVRFSSSGKKTCVETLDLIPECVAVDGGKIAVYDGNAITIYSSKGKETDEIETQNYVSSIFFCSGEICGIENGAVIKY